MAYAKFLPLLLFRLIVDDGHLKNDMVLTKDQGCISHVGKGVLQGNIIGIIKQKKEGIVWTNCKDTKQRVRHFEKK